MCAPTDGMGRFKDTREKASRAAILLHFIRVSLQEQASVTATVHTRLQQNEETVRDIERERERERERKRERETERETERNREGDREKQRGREKERERKRDRKSVV